MGIWEILCAICCRKNNTNIKIDENIYNMQSEGMLKIQIKPLQFQETKNSSEKQIYQAVQVTIVTNKHCNYLSNNEHKYNETSNKNSATGSTTTELTKQLPVTKRNLQCNCRSSKSINSTSTSYIPCQGEINKNGTYLLTSTKINSKQIKSTKFSKLHKHIAALFPKRSHKILNI